MDREKAPLRNKSREAVFSSPSGGNTRAHPGPSSVPESKRAKASPTCSPTPMGKQEPGPGLQTDPPAEGLPSFRRMPPCRRNPPCRRTLLQKDSPLQKDPACKLLRHQHPCRAVTLRALSEQVVALNSHGPEQHPAGPSQAGGPG